MKLFATRYLKVALSIAGSAILLFSCEKKAEELTEAQKEAMMTESSDNLSVIMSQNGRRSYHFEAPLVEGYALARDPYREFPEGVTITTYKNDSLTAVDVTLTANYAIYYDKRDLWEARGDVVVEKSDGKTLYTQQLFWNAKTNKIYSNVDSKIVQNDGRDTFIGEGFESDEEFKDWRFRRMKGRMEVEMKERAEGDSTRVETTRRRDAALEQSLRNDMPRVGEPLQRPVGAPIAPAAQPSSPASKPTLKAAPTTGKVLQRTLPGGQQVHLENTQVTTEQPALEELKKEIRSAKMKADAEEEKSTKSDQINQ